MKKYLCMMLCLCIVNILMVGIEKDNAYNNEILQLSAMMADRISRSGIQTVAVADFTDLQGNVTELGRFLAEHISVALAGSGRSIMVVDRTHIRTLLKEHKLSSTGLIDPSTAKQLGKIAGVEALITGTITPFGDTVDMTIKVLHTETAKIIDANTVSLAKTNTFEELLRRGINTGQQSSPNTGISNIQPQESQHTVVANGFSFILKECQRTGGNVICHILSVSDLEDRELEINRDDNGRRTRMIDELGNEYIATQIKLGDAFSKKGELFHKLDTHNLLVKGIPTKTLLYFEGVPSEINTIALVELDCGSKGDFRIQFRGIQLVMN